MWSPCAMVCGMSHKAATEQELHAPVTMSSLSPLRNPQLTENVWGEGNMFGSICSAAPS